MGDIGRPVRKIDLEPLPETAPMTEPSPSPVETPQEEPVPA